MVALPAPPAPASTASFLTSPSPSAIMVLPSLEQTAPTAPRSVHETVATSSPPHKLLKIGVRIRVSVRAVRLSFDEGFPDAGLFGQVLARLQSLPLRC